MKISDVIKKLEGIKSSHGEIDVFFFDWDNGKYLPVDKISVFSKGECKGEGFNETHTDMVVGIL